MLAPENFKASVAATKFLSASSILVGFSGSSNVEDDDGQGAFSHCHHLLLIIQVSAALDPRFAISTVQFSLVWNMLYFLDD